MQGRSGWTSLICLTSSSPLIPGIFTSQSTRSSGLEVTTAIASAAFRAVETTVSHTAENPFQSSSIEFLVVDYEDVGFLQGGTSASGGSERSVEVGSRLFKATRGPSSQGRRSRDRYECHEPATRDTVVGG